MSTAYSVERNAIEEFQLRTALKYVFAALLSSQGIVHAQDSLASEPTPPSTPGAAATPFLLDDTIRPHITVSWPTRKGGIAMIEGDRDYLTAAGRTPMGRNLEVYVGLGGARLDAGLVEGDAWLIRAGFYKADRLAPLFEDLADNADITVTISGIRFTGEASPVPETWLLHGKYDAPTAVCAPGPQGVQMYAATSQSDTLKGRITHKNGRMGVLNGKSGDLSFETVQSADGKPASLTMKAVIPYRLFKHPDDPWLRENPGDFDEPWHFHIEFEVIPAQPVPLPQNPAPDAPSDVPVAAPATKPS